MPRDRRSYSPVTPLYNGARRQICQRLSIPFNVGHTCPRGTGQVPGDGYEQFIVHTIPGDGDCAITALNYLLTGGYECTDRLRHLLVDYEEANDMLADSLILESYSHEALRKCRSNFPVLQRSHSGHLTPVPVSTKEKYFREAKVAKTWMGCLEFEAAANLFGCSIFAVENIASIKFHAVNEYHPKPKNVRYSQEDFAIWLLSRGNHFDCIVPRDRRSYSPAKAPPREELATRITGRTGTTTRKRPTLLDFSEPLSR